VSGLGLVGAYCNTPCHTRFPKWAYAIRPYKNGDSLARFEIDIPIGTAIFLAMENIPNQRRRSIRLKDYDYSSVGAYFITACTQNRQCLFGEIKNGETISNEAGRMVQSVWDKLPNRFPTTEPDECVVMPNHIHGIIVLVGAPLVGAQIEKDEKRVGTRPTPTLGDVIGAFKSITTNEYILGVNGKGWPPFSNRLWQRNYYENIIRNEQALNKIREYIAANPLQWEFDLENPLVEPNTVRHSKGWSMENDFL